MSANIKKKEIDLRIEREKNKNTTSFEEVVNFHENEDRYGEGIELCLYVDITLPSKPSHTDTVDTFTRHTNETQALN